MGSCAIWDSAGAANFRKLMAEMHRRKSDEQGLMFMAFDVLHQDGIDLRQLQLSERKRDLHRLCAKSRVPRGANLPERRTAVRSLQQFQV
jgi:ATP-dependent DNA ligase